MKQVIRSDTFETNSSSYHTLIVISKELYDKFIKEDDIYFMPYGDKQFITDRDVPTLDDFKEEYPEFEELDEYSKEDAIHDFIGNYFNVDYGIGFSSWYLDAPTATVYDKDGNEQVAMSIYIGDF